MTQMTDNSQIKEVLEREFLVVDLQTVLREFGLPQYGRKPDLIQKALQLIDEEYNDSQTISAAKQKIIEVYNQRKNVEEVVPKSTQKAFPKRTKNLIDSSFEDESNDDSSEVDESETVTSSSKQKRLMEGHMKRATIHTSLALVLLAVIAFCLINDKINFDFDHYQKVKPQNLTEIGPRIQYVLQHSTPGVVWLLFCTLYVISKRLNTPAVIPTSGHEYLIESAKNIFLNSLEQFVMSLTSQLILVTYLTSKQVLNIIPVLNLLFIVGRIAFWLGYPMNRGFGMTLSLVPLIGSIAFINYRYFGLFF